jgi:hypothetical protein
LKPLGEWGITPNSTSLISTFPLLFFSPTSLLALWLPHLLFYTPHSRPVNPIISLVLPSSFHLYFSLFSISSHPSPLLRMMGLGSDSTVWWLIPTPIQSLTSNSLAQWPWAS